MLDGKSRAVSPSTSKASLQAGPGFVELSKKNEYQNNPEKFIKLL